MYAVRDDARAGDVWGRLNFFLREGIDFKSLIVCEDLHELSKKSQTRLTADGDKVIFLETFRQNGLGICNKLSA